MPELPEVQTTVDGLNQRVLSRTLIDVWSDWEKTVKKPKSFAEFKKIVKNKKIVKVWRRAKNVIIDLSDGYSLLVHMKMTGHILVGKWKLNQKTWEPVDVSGPLADPYNRFLHNIFFLDDGQMMALSDVRKFAKIELWKTDKLLNSEEFAGWGPEPLEGGFTLEIFKKILAHKNGKIKQVIMVPQVIAGIGNIYASEALWEAKINPEKNAGSLTNKEFEALYQAIRKVLALGIKLGGGSFSDYRRVDGSKGEFGQEHRVYQRQGKSCYRCKTAIKSVKHGGRSTFFCPKCQK